jgi:GNAT superfamily N-acetyltransferase
MDDADLRTRMDAGMPDFWASLTPTVIRRDGLVAAVNPLLPERSVPNSVFARDAGVLEAHIDAVTEAYDEAGVLASMAWVDEHDTDSGEVLARRGYVLDGTLLRMGVELDASAPRSDPPRPVEEVAPAAVAGIVDASFGGAIGAALAHAPAAHVYRVGDDACLVCHDTGPDCGIYVVATRPESRRQGLAGALVARALEDAAARGRTTATLQASAAGAGVYRARGFRPVGAVALWERRLHVSDER